MGRKKVLTEEQRKINEKESQKKYKEKNFKYQSICFRIEELEAIEIYCKENNIPKNTFFRKVTMEAIGKYFE